MIPYDVDPTLHSCEPQEPKLDDGCTQPGVEPVAPSHAGDLPSTVETPAPLKPVLGEKSDF
jgi:hypothetical protein